jgi:hypothetical protein
MRNRDNDGIYASRPKPRTARKVWDWFVKTEGKEPVKMWYNAPSWQKPGDTADYRGFWVAQIGYRDVDCVLCHPKWLIQEKAKDGDLVSRNQWRPKSYAEIVQHIQETKEKEGSKC